MGLVLDCHDPARLGQFWAAALGYANLGAFGTYVVLVDEEGKSPKLILQGVPEEKVAKNRMHVDIEVPDIEAEATHLEGLGARRLEAGPREELGIHWIVMADPEGNEFCVCDGGASGG